MGEGTIDETLFVLLPMLLIFAILGFTLVGSATPAVGSAERQATAQANPSDIAVQLTALQETNDVRYSVTIINSSDRALPGLYALVALPTGANLIQGVQTY